MCIVSAVYQIDAKCPRDGPVPASKIRNRDAHCVYGNSSETKLERGKRKQIRNLIPNARKKKKLKAPTAKPAQLQNAEQSRRSSLQVSEETDEEIWVPPTRPPAPAAPNRSVSTQTHDTSSHYCNQISHDDMRQLQVQKSFTDQQMFAIATFMRQKSGWSGIIEPGYKAAVVEHHKLLDDLFVVSSIVDRISHAPKPLIICSQATTLYQRIEKHFQRPIRVAHHGVDSGGGFLKFDVEYEFEPTADSKEADPDMSLIIMYAVAPDVAESHSVFREVYGRLDLPVEQFFHTFHADLKAAAYVTGIEQAMSSFPCVYCEIQITVSTTIQKQMQPAKPRSSRSNRRRFKLYLRDTNKGSKTAAFTNRCCIYDPLAVFRQDSIIITWLRLPQVHLLHHFNWYINKTFACSRC